MGKRPNIVMILSDDQGAWSLGSYGNKEVITPHLDRLAGEGVRFEHFYCTSPVCSPARASIMTGKMPSQHGVLDWLGGGSVDKKEFEGLQISYKKSLPYLAKQPLNPESISEDARISFEETVNYQKYMTYEKGGIRFLEGQRCYPQILHEAGYECGLAGKWHLGDSAHPQEGFDYWEAIARGGTNYYLPEYMRDGKVSLEDRYVTDIITEDAVRFIEQSGKKEKPFYLSVHYTAPHDPWEASDQPEEVWKLYDGCSFQSVPDEPRHPWQVLKSPQPSGEEERRYYAQGYYTCITAMDRGVGMLVEALERQGVLDDTIIFFTSDNGFNLGHHGIWGKGNGTFPLNMYETSIQVPFIAYGKGRIREGMVCDTLVSQYDIFPTLLELAGCLNEEDLKGLPGVSFAGLLNGSKKKIREDVVVYDEYGPVRMIRDERYKLIYRTPYGPHELYDMQQDPQENENLIEKKEYQSVKNSLYLRLKDWFWEFEKAEYSGSRFPVTGNGQMNRLEEFGQQTVFRSF